MERENTKIIAAAKPVCHYCGHDVEPYTSKCGHCGKLRIGYGKAEKKKGLNYGKR